MLNQNPPSFELLNPSLNPKINNDTLSFGVVYRGGFGIPLGLQSLNYLLTHNDEVEGYESHDRSNAYVWSANAYVNRKLQQDQYRQFYIPTFEDMCRQPYREDGVIENVPRERLWATLNPYYAGEILPKQILTVYWE